MKGIITNIQRFSIHDGPGIRTTVFLKGCPLRCRWCHNPETQDMHPQVQFNKLICTSCRLCSDVCKQGCHSFIDEGHVFNSTACVKCMACVKTCMPKALEVCGIETTVKEVMCEVERDRPFYGETGGITLSGGEPMAQPEFTLSLLEEAKRQNLTTCIETCGFFSNKYVEPLMNLCDTVLWDIKDADSKRHKYYTGFENEKIIENITLAAKYKKENITIRCIIIKGITDTKENIKHISDIANKIGVQKISLLPFHPYGSSKNRSLGSNSDISMGKEYIPSPDRMNELKNYCSLELYM